MGRSGPREGRALLSAPLCSKLGGDTADTACHLQPCQDQVLLSSPQGAPHHHSRGQWGQRAGDSLRGGSLATTLSKTQPAANLPPANSSLHFPVSEQTRLREFSVTVLPPSGKGQNGCGARGVGDPGWGTGYYTTPSSGVWCQHYGTKPPADGETVQPEVSRDLLKATGWLPPHELLRRLGCWPQEEGWPWEQRQGSGALVEGDCSTWARGPQPPPFTLPSSSHPHP